MATYFPAKKWLNVRFEDSPATNSTINNEGDIFTRVESVVQEIEQKHIDITEDYENWLRIGFAFANEFGEGGRNLFHRVSKLCNKYNAHEADVQYDKCLKSRGSGVTIATFFGYAKETGITIPSSKSNNIQSQSIGYLDKWKNGDEISSRWIMDEEMLPHFPEEVFSSLPPFVDEVLSHCISPNDRDMMLMGTLTCLSATLHNVVGEYNSDDWHPMLYFFVMADAGMGKGALKYCRELVAPIHNQLREESDQAIKAYKARKKMKKEKGEDAPAEMDEEPQRKTLFIPTNSSASAVIQQLDNNGGIGLIFDTECDTLSATLSTDFGDYSTILRKGYHHETIDLNRRKDDEYRVIERPMLAICLSGTPGQLHKLTPQAEDGTFSRITCYHMPFQMEFRDVLTEQSTMASSNGLSLRDRFFQLGLRYKRMREDFLMGGSYRVVIPQELCAEFNEHFRELNEKAVEDISNDMQSVVRRLAFAVFRIMMVLTAIRYMDSNTNPLPADGDMLTTLRCTPEDFRTAMAMGDVLIYHTVYCYAHLPQSKVETSDEGKIVTKRHKMESLYAELPDTFNRAIFNATSKRLGYSPATTSKWINDYIRQSRLQRTEQNGYRKL